MVSGGVVSKALFTCSIDGVLLEDISDAFVDGSVRYREDQGRGVMTFTMDLKGPQVVTPLSDFVTPFVTYTYDDGTVSAPVRLGVFVAGEPDVTLTQRTSRLSAPCEDLTAVVRDSVTDAPYKIPSGTNIATAIGDALEAAGIVRYRLPRSTKTTGYTRNFPTGTSHLEIVNNLTTAARWWPVSMALDGAITTQPSRLLSQSQAVATITNADYIGEVLHKPTRGMLGNVVKVRRERSDQPTLYAIERNTDADSPISIPNVGREIPYMGGWIEARDAEDQGDVDELAARLIEEARSYERTVQVTVPPNPSLLGSHRVLDFDIETSDWDVFGRHWLREWTAGLTPQDAAYSLTVNRLVRAGRGEDVT
jgi:hypothetical protein